MKTLNQKIKLVEAAFVRLDCLNNINWTPYRDKLHALALESEKQHRGSAFGHPHAASATVCAKMFAVRWIAGYLCRADKLPKLKQVLSLRPDVVLAAALVVNYRKEIRAALKGFDLAELAALDYCEFVGQPSAA